MQRTADELGIISASAEIRGVKIAKDATILVGGKTVRHVSGVISGKVQRNEPGVPSPDKVVGCVYKESPQDKGSALTTGRRSMWILPLFEWDANIQKQRQITTLPAASRTPEQTNAAHAENLP